MRKPRGLTMIEMMFAMLVLFMVGVFVMDMFVSGSRQMVRAAKNEKMSALLRAKVSEERNIPFSSLAAGNGSFPAPDNKYIYSVDVSNLSGVAATDSQVVTVSVTHPDLGQMVNRIVRSNVPVLDPGQVAFNKFGCASCHALPAAGYPDNTGLVRLDKIGDQGTPRPYQTDPSISFQDYVMDSLVDPDGFNAYSGDPTITNVMTAFIVEGQDPNYDPAYGVSATEMSDLATWIETFDTGP